MCWTKLCIPLTKNRVCISLTKVDGHWSGDGVWSGHSKRRDRHSADWDQLPIQRRLFLITIVLKFFIFIFIKQQQQQQQLWQLLIKRP